MPGDIAAVEGMTLASASSSAPVVFAQAQHADHQGRRPGSPEGGGDQAACSIALVTLVPDPESREVGGGAGGGEGHR